MSRRRRRAHVWLVASIATTTSCDWFRSAGPSDPVLWIARSSGYGRPQPALDPSHVFAVDGSGAVAAFDKVSGAERWRVPAADGSP